MNTGIKTNNNHIKIAQGNNVKVHKILLVHDDPKVTIPIESTPPQVSNNKPNDDFNDTPLSGSYTLISSRSLITGGPTTNPTTLRQALDS
jgi:hypothetical protein